MPTIAVLVKNVPDTWSTKSLEDDFTLDRENVDSILDEVGEFAVETALQIRDAHEGYRVVAVTMGPAGADEALRKALAMGADDAIHVLDDALAGSDLLGTAWALTNALNQIADLSLIVAGNASSDGQMGALPGVIAEYRQIPALTQVTEVAVAEDGAAVTAQRDDNHGRYSLSAPLPAIVSVTDQAAQPRFPNFKGLMAAKKHEITVLPISELGVAPEQVGGSHAATAVVAAQPRAERAAGDMLRGDAALDRAIELIAEV